MNKSTSNECVAQGAATWNEREEHMRIMKAIDGVAYCMKPIIPLMKSG